MPAARIDTAFSDTGSGEPVILVHGVGARQGGWTRFCAHLGAGYRCIGYDLRGHGATPAPDAAFGLDDLVDDLEDLHARLGVGPAHVAGHSLGAMIAAAYALRRPEAVRSVGLFSTAAFRNAEDRAKVLGVAESLEKKGVAPTLDTLVARWFSDDFLARSPEAVEARKQQVVDTPPDIFCNVFRIYAETRMEAWLHEVATPALVMTGSEDGGCNPRLNRQIADALPDAELVLLEGLKHAILIEAPERAAAAYRTFLERMNKAGMKETTG